MTDLDKLTAWLDQPAYNAGVLLYEKLLGEGFLLSMLKRGADDYNRKQLAKALTQKHAELVTQAQAVRDSYPEPLLEQLGTGGLLMDERTILKERMRVLYNSGVSESPELKEMAFRILSIKDELDRIYGRKHFFEQNGFLPDQASAPPEAETPADLLRRRNSVRTYVTKYKKQLETTYEPAEREKVQKKLTRFQAELLDLDQHITLTTKSHGNAL